MCEHDPFNKPDTANPRARELMVESFFWDCVDEDAPFGSDEGNDAYYEWRSWRKENPEANLSECMDWILDGNLEGYNETLYSDECIKRDSENPDDAFLADNYDIFTLDATIIATTLGQLMDEGKIDNEAKKYALIAVNRQLHPLINSNEHRKKILEATKRVIGLA